MTLQELKEKLEEEAKQHIKDDSEIVAEKLDEIMDQFLLTHEQANYAISDLVSLEEQTNKKTLINSKKASEILLKRKAKK